MLVQTVKACATFDVAKVSRRENMALGCPRMHFSDCSLDEARMNNPESFPVNAVIS